MELRALSTVGPIQPRAGLQAEGLETQLPARGGPQGGPVAAGGPIATRGPVPADGLQTRPEGRRTSESDSLIFNPAIQFSIDRATQRIVVRIVDRVTQEVIRQIPPEEVLRISVYLQRFRGHRVDTRA